VALVKVAHEGDDNPKRQLQLISRTRENVSEIKQMNSYVLERRRLLCSAKNRAKCNENS